MRKPDKTDYLFAIVFLMIGLFLGTSFLKVYPTYEHHLNSTNPLVLGDNNFMLCKIDGNYGFKAIWNSVNSELNLVNYCKESRYNDELYSSYGEENIRIMDMQNIDKLFSGQEEKINTQRGTYYITKLREETVRVNQWESEIGIVLRIEDRTDGERFIWQ